MELFTPNLLSIAVTMQAQRVAPPGLECKDKFLIQSIVVPFGATDEDITSDMVRIEHGISFPWLIIFYVSSKFLMFLMAVWQK